MHSSLLRERINSVESFDQSPRRVKCAWYFQYKGIQREWGKSTKKAGKSAVYNIGYLFLLYRPSFIDATKGVEAFEQME
jgi:hypothetical protein